MYRKRTDLAMEMRELHAETGVQDGISERTRVSHGVTVTELCISPGVGEQKSGKKSGTYITLDVGDIHRAETDVFEGAATALAEELKKLLPGGDGCVLVAGLGNDRITPDSVGPRVAGGVLVTRHIKLLNRPLFEDARFGELAAVVPGVLGQTGIESAEIIRSVTEQIRPRCVIAIDALASRRLARLATTVQLSDTGICPGSGVSNKRAELSRETLGVPVISIGVPTVVDAGTLAYDLLEELAEQEGLAGTSPLFDGIIEKLLTGAGKDFFITPRDSDAIAASAAKLISAGINLALHDGMTLAELAEYRGIG